MKEKIQVYVSIKTLGLMKRYIRQEGVTTKQLRDQAYTALKEFEIPKHPSCVKLEG